jgi:mRNA interferase RelE/StbE
VSWTVEVQRPAEKELAALPLQAGERIWQRSACDGRRPVSARSQKKLKARDGYRVRVGDYRILFTVNCAARLVRVGAIGHRKDVYR